MRVCGWALLAASSLCLTTVWSSAAHGQEVAGDGRVSDGELGTHARQDGPAGAGSAASGGGTLIVYWERNREYEQVGLPWYCNDGPDEDAPWLWFDLVDARTGEVLDYAFQCYWGEDAEGPPEPPTVEEVLDSVDIPEPEIAVNPATRGLTGLESWFWLADPETTVQVGVELDGWTVDAELTAGEWGWQIGDEGSYTATSPGSEQEPAARHTFDAKGTHTITVDTVWTGGWVLSYTPIGGDPIVAEVGDLDAETESRLDYEVVEARAVVDDPHD
jgi:hypothetical protein